MPSRTHRGRFAPTLLLLTTLFYLLFQWVTPNTAHAVMPPSVSISASAGPSWLMLGDVGRYTKRGFLVSIKNEITWPYIGVVLGIGRSDYLSTQQAPPYNYLLGFYSFQVGLTTYITWGGLRLQVDPSYRRYGILTNSLIRYTGPVSGYHALGGDIEISYRISSFSVGIRPSTYYLFGANTLHIGAELTVQFSFGN